jgi:hypothetical protein
MRPLQWGEQQQGATMNLTTEVSTARGSRDTERTPAPESYAPRSLPPPLPESARRLSTARAAADAEFAECMIERLAASDYQGVLLAADALLEHQPNHADALDCAQIARSELAKLYLQRLGPMQRVPRVAMSTEALLTLRLDFGAGLLLSHVDGRTCVGDLVEQSGLPRLDTLRSLSELFLRRAIVFDS